MPDKASVAKSCKLLLEEYRQGKGEMYADKLVFAGVDGKDVYNIAAPFEIRGETVLPGRVERRDSECSEIVFFTNRDGVWTPLDKAPVLELQDPFFTFIAGELVLGGVEVSFDQNEPEKIVSWRTNFYRGSGIDDLRHFATGPEHMKDIRPIGLADGRVGIFTRPHGLKDARALIGFTIVDSLDELTAEAIDKAELFRDQFLPAEWGGANEPHLLPNGWIGVLGHISYMEAHEILHYHAMTFAFNPQTGEKTPIKIIAVRDDFPDGPAKRPNLQDVIFSGGLVRQTDGTAWLYAGVSDAEAYRIRIPDPFAEYEKLL